MKIFDTINLNNETFNDFIHFDEEVIKKNRKLCGQEFSEEHCAELWKKVLSK